METYWLRDQYFSTIIENDIYKNLSGNLLMIHAMAQTQHVTKIMQNYLQLAIPWNYESEYESKYKSHDDFVDEYNKLLNNDIEIIED